MKNLQKAGGIAALYSGLAYILGIIGFVLVLGTNDNLDPVQKVAALVENQISLHILHMVVFQIWALFLVVLVLALYNRLKSDSSIIIQVATAIGMIWACVVIASGMIYNIGMDTVIDIYSKDPAQAGTVWLGIHSVFNGLGGGNEILGGIWLLLISWTALSVGKFPKTLNYFGFIIGAVGIISAFPGLSDLGMIFGITQIVWFIWIGIIMIGSNPETAEK